MSKLKVARRCFQELLLILSISLVPVGFGLLMMLYQHDQKHQENAHGAVTTTIVALDQALDHLQRRAQGALTPIGTPNATPLTCQLRNDDLSMIATMIDLALRNLLRGKQTDLIVQFDSGHCVIRNNSDRHGASGQSPKEFAHTAKSDKYGYSVTAGYPNGYSAQRTRRTLMRTLPALALVGVFTGLIAYWSIFCHRGQRNRTAVNSTSQRYASITRR